jgi:hypothetical protein
MLSENAMTKYMVIEKYRKGCFDKIYKRFHSSGRMLPEGLSFIESWLEKDGKRCFQLMETENYDLFHQWIKNWADLVDFEIIEIGTRPTDNLKQ